jgi:hypothetical protein
VVSTSPGVNCGLGMAGAGFAVLEFVLEFVLGAAGW